MRKLCLMCCLIIFATVILPAGGQEEVASANEVYKLRLTYMVAVNDPLDIFAHRFKEVVEEKTDARLQIQLFPAGQLGAEGEYFEGLQLGTVDMGLVSPEYISNTIPEFAVVAFPYLFENWDHVQAFYDSAQAEALSKQLLDTTGIRLVMWLHNGFRDMATVSKPIRALSDFEGMKFRSPEIPLYINMFRAIGASPTPIPWTEVYTALKSNVVEGMESSPKGILMSNVHEVGKYVIKTGHIYGGNTMLMSEASFQKLPADLQKVIIDTARELSVWQKELMISQNDEAYDKLIDNGMTILDIEKAPLREAMSGVWDTLSAKTPGMRALADDIVELSR